MAGGGSIVTAKSGYLREGMMIEVPEIPEPERIESMCMRFDHAHGIKQVVVNRDFDSLNHFVDETDEEFYRRQEVNRSIMRQLYEEATGQGFFKAKANP